MEHRNLHALSQRSFDKETFRCFDIFQINSAERRLKAGNDLDKLARILLSNLNVEHVYAGKLLEQARLTLHHWLARKRPDVAETEYCAAITDYSNQICAGGKS